MPAKAVAAGHHRERAGFLAVGRQRVVDVRHLGDHRERGRDAVAVVRMEHQRVAAPAFEMAGHARQDATAAEQVGDERQGFRRRDDRLEDLVLEQQVVREGDPVPRLGGLVLDVDRHAGLAFHDADDRGLGAGDLVGVDGALDGRVADGVEFGDVGLEAEVADFGERPVTGLLVGVRVGHQPAVALGPGGLQLVPVGRLRFGHGVSSSLEVGRCPARDAGTCRKCNASGLHGTREHGQSNCPRGRTANFSQSGPSAW